MKFSIFQDTRQGQRRYNQDRIAYCYSRDTLLMVVADGMGAIFMAKWRHRSPSST